MKNSVKRILSITMAIVMLMSMSVVAFAATSGLELDDGTYGIWTDTPTTSSTTVQITFPAGDNYDLTPASGTKQLADGTVVLEVSVTPIAKNLVPTATATEDGAKVVGWGIKDKDGNLVEIDITKYDFKGDTKVYPIIEGGSVDDWVPYKDMKQDRSDWYYKYVRDLSIAGVVDGMPGYYFDPNGQVTWGQALKLVLLATGYDTQDPTAAHWASGYLTKAQADALVDADKAINLDAPITRIEFAKLAAAAMDLDEPTIATPFGDTDDADVLALYVAKIVEGSFNADGVRMFLPKDNITRAEMSAIIWRIYNYYA